MTGTSIALRREGHSEILRGSLKDLAQVCRFTSSFSFMPRQNEAYWNVMVFCCDGTLALNRLSVGLIFPQLKDEISVICPVRVRPYFIGQLLLDVLYFRITVLRTYLL